MSVPALAPLRPAETAQAWRGALSRSGFSVALLVLALLLRLPRLGVPFVDYHDFRQTQTALAVQGFLDHGVDVLRYETPVFGPPWTLPFEFPTYQLTVYPLASVGVPIELACRILALAWFFLSAVLLLLVARRWTDPTIANVALLLYLFSPFAILWSRACLIDYASVALALAYLLAGGSWARSGRALPLLVAVAAGALAYVTKITTVAVFLPAVVLVAGHACLRLRRKAGTFLQALALLAVPFAFGMLWTAWADHVKAGSPSTAWLTSKGLSVWNFGTWAQRLTPGEWQKIGMRIYETVVPGALVLLLVPALILAWRKRGSSAGWAILAALAGAILTVATFFNLYAVHDYYLIAVTAPLALLAGAGLVALGRLPVPGAAVVATALLLAGPWPVWRTRALPYALAAFVDRSHDPLLALAHRVAEITPPQGWVVIEGEDWNPRLVFWAHRRGFYVKPGVTDPARVAGRPEVSTIVCKTCPAALLALWPDRRPGGSEAGFQLFSVGAPPP